MGQDRPLRVLFLSAEVVPFVKTGGLADVAGSLPSAIRAEGLDVRVAMPRYSRIDRTRFSLEEMVQPFSVKMDGQTESASIMRGVIGTDTPVYMVNNAKYFYRDGIYMYPDDAERFIFFCRAALEMLKQPELDWRPDILHCNDWHTAIVPNWLKTIYADDPFFAETATVCTIHNLAYQGIFGYRVLEIAGIDEYGFLHHAELADLAEVVDLMARGIYYADVINTVSETYAREILTPEFGEKLDPLLRDRRDRLFGILNGIDTDLFDPATDQYVRANYDTSTLDQRVENKLALQRERGLAEDRNTPLVGMVSRFTDQKGFDLISEIIEPALRHLDFQLVMVGTGEQHYHDAFGDLARRYPDRVAVFLTFNAPLAQRVFAGADMYLMPSRFEPCGLSQIIAMRYGSVPIVRATGGLADTVVDFDPTTGHGTGFSFDEYDGMALYAALVRALETYRHQDVWRKLMLRGMTADYSWEASAKKYIDLYHRALAIKSGERMLEDCEIAGSGEPPAEVTSTTPDP